MRLSILAGLFSLLFATVAPSVAHAQNAKLRLERFGFDKLPDIKLYLTYVEEDGTVIAGRAATDFKLQLDAADDALVQQGGGPGHRPPGRVRGRARQAHPWGAGRVAPRSRSRLSSASSSRLA